jgi:hypothetical protein
MESGKMGEIYNLLFFLSPSFSSLHFSFYSIPQFFLPSLLLYAFPSILKIFLIFIKNTITPTPESKK